VDFLQPRSWPDALAAKTNWPDAQPLAGGTDVLVDLNFDRHRPAALLDLGRVGELAGWSRDDDALRLGAGLTYTIAAAELVDDLPGLAMAARSVGSPQIRNRGTIGGNLGSASPAGDAHPPLLAAGAEVELASAAGSRRVPIREFFLGPKRNALAPDELIAAVLVPRATGPQQFAKVGTRNAMVIAVCSFALALHPDHQRVGTGIGSAGPVPLVADDAERFCEGALAESDLWSTRAPIEESTRRRFGELVAAASRPIDDVRGSAAYRSQALSVLAARVLGWAWADYRRS
jgi:CO/xanthine dehydrogenase FAD-binding subunit